MPGGGTAAIGSLPGIAGVLEVFGGLLMFLGLFTRPVAFLWLYFSSAGPGPWSLDARLRRVDSAERRSTYK